MIIKVCTLYNPDYCSWAHSGTLHATYNILKAPSRRSEIYIIKLNKTSPSEISL